MHPMSVTCAMTWGNNKIPGSNLAVEDHSGTDITRIGSMIRL